MRPQRSAGDGEWGAHIRHQANASPSDQSRHENSSAELPRLPHDDAKKGRLYSSGINRNILPTRDWHFGLQVCHTLSSQDVAADPSARPGVLGCAGWVLPLLLLLFLLPSSSASPSSRLFLASPASRFLKNWFDAVNIICLCALICIIYTMVYI